MRVLGALLVLGISVSVSGAAPVEEDVHAPAATPRELRTWNRDAKHRFGMKWKATASEPVGAPKSGSYGPEKAIDGDPATAWCFRKKNAWIDICDTRGEGLNMYTELKAIGIIPGFAKSDELFRGNGRVTRFRAVDQYEPAKAVTFDIRELPRTAADSMIVFGELQPHQFSPVLEPLTALFHGLHRCLRIEILDFMPGSKSRDVCISELVPQVRWDE